MKERWISIGGSDNIGGAGVIADVKVGEYFNCFVSVVFTCITAQDFHEVYLFKKSSDKLIFNQLKMLLKSNLAYHYAKISIIPSLSVLPKLLMLLKKYKIKFIYDTVFVKNKNKLFFVNSFIKTFLQRISNFAFLITSNKIEFETLLKINKIIIFKNYNKKKIEKLIKKISQIYKIHNYIVRGIQLTKNRKYFNILYTEKKFYYFSFKYYEIKNQHGTGCAFTAALTSLLSKNESIINSFKMASKYATNTVKYSNYEDNNDYSINFNLINK